MMVIQTREVTVALVENGQILDIIWKVETVGLPGEFDICYKRKSEYKNNSKIIT